MTFRVYLYDHRGIIVVDHAIAASSTDAAVDAAARMFRASRGDLSGFEVWQGESRVAATFNNGDADHLISRASNLETRTGAIERRAITGDVLKPSYSLLKLHYGTH